MKKAEHLFYVYFVGDVFLNKPYSEAIFAQDPEDAAKLFFLKHVKEYDCKIDTTGGVFSASELFPERKLVSLEKEIAKLNSNLIVDNLDQHSKDILFEIYKLFPEWLTNAKNDGDWKERFNIEWQSPYPGNPTMYVSTAWGDYEDLVVGFGPEHKHMLYDHQELITFESWVLKANDYLGKFKSEDLICYETKGFWSGFGLASKYQFEELIKNGKLKKAYSWLGTYNYPKEK